MNRFLILLFLLISSKYSIANNISIQRVSLIDTNRVAKTISVRINISWDNSWRDDVKWDAAWIFFKYKEPKDSIWKWRHGSMSKTGNYPGNSNAALKFVVPDDLKGGFLYRQTNGSGNIKSDSLTFLWNYGNDGVLNIDSVEVRVFATEMVYVSEGMFSIGDGNGQQRSYFSFQLKNAPNNYVTITDKWSPLINTFINNNSGGIDDINLYRDGIRISGLDGLDIDGDKSSDYTNFPTGYRAFYTMKYEVTQGQYADFLNSLSLKDTNNMFYVDTSRLKRIHPKHKQALQNLDPFLGYVPTESFRHSISLDTVEVKYRVSRPDRAYGMANQNHFVSFIDWAGLRPMTELEFEKACRGPLPPYYWSPTGNIMRNDTTIKWGGGDWAWGNDTTTPRSNNSYGGQNILTFSGIENGTESFSNYNILKRYINPQGSASVLGNIAGMYTFTGGDDGRGPFRVGIFANDSSSRISSGASYYGIMDLSKNVHEMVISISSNNSRTFSYKIHGDGMLNASGQSQDFYINTFMGPVTNSFLMKSGEVSNRSMNYSPQGFTGFRGVRTATPDN